MTCLKHGGNSNIDHFTQNRTDCYDCWLTERKRSRRMKVAFDVQGTLEGSWSERVVKLFKWFEAKGCEMYVWSYGGAGMAARAANKHSLKAKCQSKEGRYGFGKEPGDPVEMDLCVDDEADAEEMLSVGKCILVHTIPEDESKFDEVFGHLVRGES